MPLPAESRSSSPTRAYVPVAEEIADGLRRAILDWKLRPGERIRQEALADKYGVSRLPVRQALQRLAIEGLVDFTAHVGARVAVLEPKDLDELYKIRELVEPLAIAESGPHLSKRQLAGLRDLQGAMEKVGGDDRKRWIWLDRRFHLLTYAGAPLPRLRRMIEELWNVVQPYRLAYTARPETIDSASQEHRLILEALTRGDEDEAAQAAGTHIRRTRLALLERSEVLDTRR